MLSKFLVAASLVLALSAVGCATAPVRVDPTNDRSGTVMGLDSRDFADAAGTMVQSMLASGVLDRPEGAEPYVLTISRIKNNTMQRIDTDQLVKKIRIDLLNSRKAIVTTAVGADGAEDAMSYQARELRGDDEFDQGRVAGKRQLQAPEMSLSGKIIEHSNRVDRRNTRVDYYFQMTLTAINSGLAWWEGEVPIVKRGSSKSVTW